MSAMSRRGAEAWRGGERHLRTYTRLGVDEARAFSFSYLSQERHACSGGALVGGEGEKGLQSVTIVVRKIC